MQLISAGGHGITTPSYERPGQIGARPDRRVRVVFCVDNLNFGGTELNAVRTAESLDRSRFQVSVACLQGADGPVAARYSAAGVPIHAFPIRSFTHPSTLVQTRKLARFLERHRADVLHAHDIYSNILGVTAARLAGTAGIIASRRWWDAHYTPGLLLANRVAYRFADAVLANCRTIGRLVEAEGVPAKRVMLIPNFLDECAFEAPSKTRIKAFRAELGIRDDAFVLGMVANFNPKKDQATLLQAAALLRPRWPRLHFVLIGEGPCRLPLQRLAVQLDIQSMVTFAGHRTDASNYHHFFDLSIHSSASEGFSNAVLEAAAAGKPIVATDVGGTPELVDDGISGLMVPAQDPARLAAAIDRLLLDPPLAAGLGAAARRYARDHHTAGVAVGALENNYLALHAARGRT